MVKRVDEKRPEPKRSAVKTDKPANAKGAKAPGKALDAKPADFIGPQKQVENADVFQVKAVQPEEAKLVASTSSQGSEFRPLLPSITDAKLPVYLGPTGVITLDPTGAPSANWMDRGEALFRLGEDLSESSGPSWLAMSSPEMQQKVFDQLKNTLEDVAADKEPPEGLTKDQATQIRASAFTVLLELIEQGPRNIQVQALSKFWQLSQKETSTRLLDMMIFQLGNSEAAKKPGLVKDTLDWLKPRVVQVSPPYQSWFPKGTHTLNLTWSLGDPQFVAGFAQMLQWERFRSLGNIGPDGAQVLEKTIHDDVHGDTTFRFTLRSSINLLDPMKDPYAKGMIGYEGHAQYGFVLANALARPPASPNGGEDMVFFFNLCSGKTGFDELRDAYPRAHIITTFASSPFKVDHTGQVNRSEGFNALMAMMKGIAKRENWDQLQHRLDSADKLVDTKFSNFMSPALWVPRSKVSDRDHDGRPDYLDKHFEVSPFRAPEVRGLELAPRVAAQPASRLEGSKVFSAVNNANVFAEQSTFLREANGDHRFVSNGWFEPLGDQDPIVKFEKRKGPEGDDQVLVSVNAGYAHMSSELMRGVVTFETARWAATQNTQLSPLDAKLYGLLAMAQAFYSTHSERAEDLWQMVMQRYQFPYEVSYLMANNARLQHAEGLHAGDPKSLRALKVSMGEELLAKIDKPEVGTPNVVPY